MVRGGVDIQYRIVKFFVWLVSSSVQIKGNVKKIDYFEVCNDFDLEADILKRFDDFFPFPVCSGSV